MSVDCLLRIENLKVYFSDQGKILKVLDGLSLEIGQSEIVALVGSSGSGKTLTGLAMLRLLPLGFSFAGGKIIFQKEDLLKAEEGRLRQIRGKDIGIIFQEPLSALNPLFTVGSQIREVLQFHTSLSKSETDSRVLDLLSLCGIPNPPKVIGDYPHQLSGGLRQRAMIAQAIAANPKLLIADEPTSNLDVTTQARIMGLFRDLRDQLGLAVLLITHDLGMVSHLADKVAIISGGRMVEFGNTQQILQNPQHSFTRELVEAVKD